MTQAHLAGFGSGALISETYRYYLYRHWIDDAPRVVWVMLNPSTADETKDDPTIRKCVGFSRMWGYGGIVVVNLFAYRATKPRELQHVADPAGAKNDRWIEDLVGSFGAGNGLIMAAWGVPTRVSLEFRCRFIERQRHVFALLGRIGMVNCLGTTAGGFPRHPLMVAYKQERCLLERAA